MATRLATLDDVRLLAPELVERLDSDPAFANLVNEYLCMYEDSFDPEDWLKKTSYGHVWLALHWLVQHGHIDDPGIGNEVSSKSFGQMSVSFSTHRNEDTTGLSATGYGKKYLDLASRIFVRNIHGPVILDRLYQDVYR